MSKASLTKSQATEDEVRKQCVMARTSNDTGMKAQDPTLPKRYQNAIFGRDGILAEDSDMGKPSPYCKRPSITVSESWARITPRTIGLSKSMRISCV